MTDTSWARLKSYTANMPLIQFTCFEEPKGYINTLTEVEWQEYKVRSKDAKSWPFIVVVQAADKRDAAWQLIDLLRLKKGTLYRVYFEAADGDLAYILIRAESATEARVEACQRLEAMDVVPRIVTVYPDDGS